jgi:hypothetical protein
LRVARAVKRSAAAATEGRTAHFKSPRRARAAGLQGRETPRCEAAAVKWVVILIFIIGALSALLWFESSERNYTPAQKMALLVTSLTAWALVFFLGAVVI